MLADLFLFAPLDIAAQWGSHLEVNKKQSVAKFPIIRNTALSKIELSLPVCLVCLFYERNFFSSFNFEFNWMSSYFIPL